MADQEDFDQSVFPPRVNQWERDPYDALRVVIDRLEAEIAALKAELLAVRPSV